MLSALPPGYRICPACQTRAYRGNDPTCPDCPAPHAATPAAPANSRVASAAPVDAGRGPVEFTVPGVPVPKGRPRVVTRETFGASGEPERHTVAFTPPTTRQWENAVRDVARLFVRAPFDGDVSVDFEFYGSNPAADVDNLIKAMLDGMQPVVFDDDRQVRRVAAVIADPDGDPRVEVSVAPWIR